MEKYVMHQGNIEYIPVAVPERGKQYLFVIEGKAANCKVSNDLNSERFSRTVLTIWTRSVSHYECEKTLPATYKTLNCWS